MQVPIGLITSRKNKKFLNDFFEVLAKMGEVLGQRRRRREQYFWVLSRRIRSKLRPNVENENLVNIGLRFL